MTSRNQLPDQEARDNALDVTSSFIVQAPAGSGKTELLTLRYLKLLVTCEQPEEVLAITFTKKAASEMRDRIIRTLNWCQGCITEGISPDSEIAQLRLQIGKAVLEKDASLNWHLLENPSRFRVQTIDSFCFYLAKQLPILSQVGGDPQLLENIDLCFREAIRNTLSYLETDSIIADDIEIILRHLDNDVARVENLLVNLLRRRDQWSNHLFTLNVPGRSGEEDLTDNIFEWVSESLESTRNNLLPFEQTLVSLFNHAVAYRGEAGNLPFVPPKALDQLPEATLEDLKYWNLLIEFLLTQDKNEPKWLSRVQSKHGFPAKTVGNAEFKARNAELKQQRTDLIGELSQIPGLIEALNYIRLLPSPDLDRNEWEFLSALFRLLHRLSGELYIAMQQIGVVDYTQISNSAMLALGDEDNPTDIALALDHVIRHILVDEFQDTSYFQLVLLEKLTAGWENNDGRSLFLVGDAMQSCYGFRNANVGIYLDVWKNSLRTVPLNTLRLTANFRSQSAVVDWVNTVFGQAFPDKIDISRGAVPYSPADAIHPAIPDQGVEISLITHAKDEKWLADQIESASVVERAHKLYKTFPEDDIAILVRNRGHLSLIVNGLRAAGLSWSATDIDRLNSLAVIDDLMSIVRITLHPGDRLNWISMLRAPWCGLGVEDLYALANFKREEQDIWSSIQQYDSIDSLSSHAKQVLGSFVEIMQYVLKMRGRNTLRNSTEAAWTLLRGPSVCESDLELESAQHFLSLLQEQERAGGITDFSEFEDAVETAFVPSPATAGSSRLHLLTMHKAKGLEFDHVLLPALNRGSRADEKPLLIWHERLNAAGDNRLFMAGLTATGEADGQLYQLLRHEQKLKNQLENTRLLYIAVTRAKKSATLFASLAKEEDGQFVKPVSNSLLARIWPAVEDSNLVTEVQVDRPSTDLSAVESAQADEPQATPIRRLLPAISLDDEETKTINQQFEEIELSDDQEDAESNSGFELESLKGTLIHRCLELYGSADDQNSFLESLPSMREYWKLKLRILNLPATQVEAEISSIESAVLNTVNHPDLSWLFDKQLQESNYEWALSRKHAGYIENRIVDRTFIDSEGTRWIIDYKTGLPGKGSSAAHFIEEQKTKYGSQLALYENMFSELESRPVKKALLLTSLPQLVELN